MRRLRMIRNSKILVAARPGGFRHRLKRVGAVGAVGMRVQNAADVFIRHERRKRAGQRARDLVRSLAKLGRNKWQAQRRVDLLLGCRGQRLAATAQTVIAERHALLGRKSAQ